jgi:hypothetical protein
MIESDQLPDVVAGHFSAGRFAVTCRVNNRVIHSGYR